MGEKNKKQLTPEEIQKLRVRIANIVARDKTIDRRCCICKQENAAILHNQENPYLITFLCRTCRTDENNVKKAEKTRFDLKEYKLNKLESKEVKTYTHTSQFTPELVKQIVEDYVKDEATLTFGEYCEKVGLSRYQFNSLIELYKKYFPQNKTMVSNVRERSKAIQRNKLSVAATARYLYKHL